jgi:hypothetical protein
MLLAKTKLVMNTEHDEWTITDWGDTHRLQAQTHLTRCPILQRSKADEAAKEVQQTKRRAQ